MPRRRNRPEDDLTKRIRDTLLDMGVEVTSEDEEVEAALKLMQSGKFKGHVLRQLQRNIVQRNGLRCRHLMDRKAALHDQILAINLEAATIEARSARLLFPEHLHDWGVSRPDEP